MLELQYAQPSKALTLQMTSVCAVEVSSDYVVFCAERRAALAVSRDVYGGSAFVENVASGELGQTTLPRTIVSIRAVPAQQGAEPVAKADAYAVGTVNADSLYDICTRAETQLPYEECKLAALQ
ncbi:hypothetical protein EBH_0082760 [Eimeria brunetti]|uniref:Uncharacterized protein n=1 Tax=Eimeria brunetti TaxID=51314 RepID=U6LUW9_9EIME|nr:hypothetical protein EBH_0082760 [Eimeria brunetti]